MDGRTDIWTENQMPISHLAKAGATKIHSFKSWLLLKRAANKVELLNCLLEVFWQGLIYYTLYFTLHNAPPPFVNCNAPKMLNGINMASQNHRNTTCEELWCHHFAVTHFILPVIRSCSLGRFGYSVPIKSGLILRCVDTSQTFMSFFTKGNYFCDSLFAFMDNMVSTSKQLNLLCREQILSLST